MVGSGTTPTSAGGGSARRSASSARSFTDLALPLVAILVLARLDLRGRTCCETLETAAFLVIGLPAGAWVDRMRFRWVLIVNDLIRAAALGIDPARVLPGTC